MRCKRIGGDPRLPLKKICLMLGSSGPQRPSIVSANVFQPCGAKAQAKRQINNQHSPIIDRRDKREPSKTLDSGRQILNPQLRGSPPERATLAKMTETTKRNNHHFYGIIMNKAAAQRCGILCRLVWRTGSLPVIAALSPNGKNRVNKRESDHLIQHGDPRRGVFAKQVMPDKPKLIWGAEKPPQKT